MEASPMEKRLRVGMVFDAVKELPAHSVGPRGSSDTIYAATAKAGYEAMQGGDPALCRSHGLEVLGSGVIPSLNEAESFISLWKENGALEATAIVGYGFESDQEIDDLVGKINELSHSYGLPLSIETHRGSITQDSWRTTQLANRLPSVRFNGDFSHWYTGQEMPYGVLEERLERLAPVFERIRFLHGRIGNRCCMQVDVGEDLEHRSVPAFREMWIRSMSGFLAADDSGESLWFCPELLGPEFDYAQAVPGLLGDRVEVGDRWTQALGLAKLAKQCFVEAQKRKPTLQGSAAVDDRYRHKIRF
jgi:hypothetical protein